MCLSPSRSQVLMKVLQSLRGLTCHYSAGSYSIHQLPRVGELILIVFTLSDHNGVSQ